MNKVSKLIMPFLCILVFSCDPGSIPETPPCKEPKPLQPSFTQDKFRVGLGESVTFTYDGPTQPPGVTLVWLRLSLDARDNGDRGDVITGNTATFTFNYVGGHLISLKAENCNEDKPEIVVSPAVVVDP